MVGVVVSLRFGNGFVPIVVGLRQNSRAQVLFLVKLFLLRIVACIISPLINYFVAMPLSISTLVVVSEAQEILHSSTRSQNHTQLRHHDTTIQPWLPPDQYSIQIRPWRLFSISIITAPESTPLPKAMNPFSAFSRVSTRRPPRDVFQKSLLVYTQPSHLGLTIGKSCVPSPLSNGH